MKTLEPQFKKNGFDFELVKRRGDFAVFRKHKGEKCESFEAVKITSHDGYTLAGIDIPAGECYPSSESWGRMGFTLPTEETALAKMAEMEAGK